jgi:Domain of unknown function (DUF4139)/N-terminal domain of unknown function (DUF4140)
MLQRNQIPKSHFMISILLLGLMASPTLAAEARPTTEPATGTVRRVVLYRGQALVTRQIQVEGPQGSQEVVVTNLPDSIVDGSMFAESINGIEVRAVRFRQRAVGEEPREEVRKMDVEISATQSQLALVQKKMELTNQKITYLDQLQGFVAPTAKAELTQGVLNAETLKELTKFSFDQRAEIATEQTALAKELQDLNLKLELLNRQRAELTQNAQRTVNEAVLFVEKADDAKHAIELNYMVSRCGWAPTYTIKGTDDRKQVQIEYNALIEQVTGENWENVELTLSTASPSLSASGPSLAPFAVALVAPAQAAELAQQQINIEQSLSRDFASNRALQQEANVQLGRYVDFQSKTSGNWSLNKFACTSQQMELLNPFEALNTVLAEGASSEAPSLSYNLPNKVSLASRTDQQMVKIFQGKLDSNFYHVAIPLLDSYVYREAEVQNGSNFGFLSGPVSVYIDNRFVGRADIPTVAQGETFVLGFGSDAQLRTRRELVKKDDNLRGGNKEVTMAYRILVENYKNKVVAMRVLDRLPHSSRSSDVRISLSDPSVPLSKDPIYLRREREKNILRWDVDIPSEASGEKAFVITYDYTLDHDRNFAITDTSNEQTAIVEFEKLENSRRKR